MAGKKPGETKNGRLIREIVFNPYIRWCITAFCYGELKYKPGSFTERLCINDNWYYSVNVNERDIANGLFHTKFIVG